MTNVEIFSTYLPYEIKCRFNYEDYKLYSTCNDEEHPVVICNNKDEALPAIWQVKLILKPLSTIDWNKCESDVGDYLTEEMERFIDGYRVKWFHILDAPYLLVQWLIKNHYDVFGAIEKGIAISE